MKVKRFGAATSILVTGAAVLSACGGGHHAAGGAATTSPAPPKIACGGKPTLRASGSTAQQNAMTRFVKAFEQACAGDAPVVAVPPAV